MASIGWVAVQHCLQLERHSAPELLEVGAPITTQARLSSGEIYWVVLAQPLIPESHSGSRRVRGLRIRSGKVVRTILDRRKCEHYRLRAVQRTHELRHGVYVGDPIGRDLCPLRTARSGPGSDDLGKTEFCHLRLTRRKIRSSSGVTLSSHTHSETHVCYVTVGPVISNCLFHKRLPGPLEVHSPLNRNNSGRACGPVR